MNPTFDVEAKKRLSRFHPDIVNQPHWEKHYLHVKVENTYEENVEEWVRAAKKCCHVFENLVRRTEAYLNYDYVSSMEYLGSVYTDEEQDVIQLSFAIWKDKHILFVKKEERPECDATEKLNDVEEELERWREALKQQENIFASMRKEYLEDVKERNKIRKQEKERKEKERLRLEHESICGTECAGFGFCDYLTSKFEPCEYHKTNHKNFLKEDLENSGKMWESYASQYKLWYAWKDNKERIKREKEENAEKERLELIEKNRKQQEELEAKAEEIRKQALEKLKQDQKKVEEAKANCLTCQCCNFVARDNWVMKTHLASKKHLKNVTKE